VKAALFLRSGFVPLSVAVYADLGCKIFPQRRNLGTRFDPTGFSAKYRGKTMSTWFRDDANPQLLTPHLLACRRAYRAEPQDSLRHVDYDLREGQPGLWRWNIYPAGRAVRGPLKFRSRELAVAACIEEINGIERTRV
jgi:hypothetical protein